MQIQLTEGQIERLPFDKEIFGRVLAVTVLCFVCDTERAIAEMTRVLRPGGRLVKLGYWSLWGAYRRIRGWFGNPIWRVRQTTMRSRRSTAVSVGTRLTIPQLTPASRSFCAI
jgi:SAM-dependent methyltransferase